MGGNDELDYKYELFKNSSQFKWSNVVIDGEKPRKQLKTKSKRVLSTKPEHIKTYRT
jgi:hypothetical protein